MRRALVLVGLAGFAGFVMAAACHERATDDAASTAYVTIGADAIATALAIPGADAHVLDRDAKVAVVELSADHLEDLSRAMHADFARCGGFELHDDIADAEAELHATEAPPTRTPAIDYSHERGALVRAILPELDAERIRATIAELSAMQTRYFASPSGAAASTWLAARWASFTTRPDVTIELVDHGWAQKSVVMTIPGTTRASEIVVIGGHLDSITMAGRSGDAPGADDDASGIATLTEVARVLLASDLRPERTLQFIAYSAEEVGLRGSQAIVRDYGKRKLNVVGALQLDMTNYQGSDKDIWLMKDFTSAPQNAFLVQLIEAYVHATWGQDACGYGCSDHASWYRAGVPASMPFEARFRDYNQKIHSRDDTLERSGNNAAHAVKFARLAAAYAIELTRADPPTI